MKGRNQSAFRKGWPSICTLAIAAIGLSFAVPAAAQNQTPLSTLLEKTGQFVQRATKHFGKVICVESVSQDKLKPNGKVAFKRESNFDYQVEVHTNGNDVQVEESQNPIGATRKPARVSLLVASGFSTLLLIFHPYYQGNFEYSIVPPDGSDAPGIVRIHFEHLHGAPSPSVLRLRGHDYPLDLEGTAWVEEGSGAIERIVTDLMSPMDQVNLRVFHSDVAYMPNHFQGNAQTYWLPVMAQVDAESEHQHWQNFYRFSDYRYFSATMQIEFSKKP